MRAKLPWLLLLLFIATAVKAQNFNVSGVVLAKEDNLPMPGVTLRVSGTSAGTQTDADGKFTIDVPQGSKLVASFIGYTTQEIPLTSQTNYTITLVAEAKALQELVVVGYGEQNRRTVTGAISSVSAEQIKNIPSPSPDQLLQGRSPGVQVSAGSGEPGSSIMVRVRGATSINASSEPLYVIDGVPIVSQNLARSTFGQPSNPLADLNPSDIESMEILKDASATAIYGARAANGVILITTKRGKAGKPTISISSYVGTSKAWKDPNELRVDGPTFERLQNEASANNWTDTYGSLTALNPSGNAYRAPYANPDGAINTNWIDPIMQRGALYNIDASVSGGSDKIKYLVSGNTFKQEGIMKPTLFDRKTFRTNLDFNASETIKLGTSIFYSTSKRNRIQNGNNINSALANAYFYPSNIPIYNADGTYNRPVWESPVAIVEETDYLMNTDRIIGNVYGDWKIANGLVFRTNWSIDNNYISENQYSNTNLTAGAGVGGTATNSVVRDFNWINENVLTYQTRLAGKHNFNILLGNTLQKNTSNSTSATGSGFPSNSFRTIAAAAVKNSTADETAWGIASFFGRVNYDFNKKYLFTGNLRYDGSSRFGANNRWGMFPSASVGWAVSEEDFMNDVKVISELKVRASYGVTGNQGGIGNFASLGLWGGQRGGLRGGGGVTPGSGGSAAYADYPGFNSIQLANPDLKWETTAQLDFGIDIGLFQDKLNVTFDYYDKQTRDMLLEVPTPRSTGYSTLLQNYGAMENKGFELGITASPIQSESFSWNVDFNISRNKNLVKKLAAPITLFSREYVRIEEGYPLFSFYVHEQLGVDEQTGDIIWNTGSDEVFNVNTDRFLIGKSAWPDFQGGLTNTFNYKGFDLMAFLQYSYGNHVFNYNRYFFEHGGERTTGYSAQQLDRWQQPGDQTDIPRLARKNYDTNLRPSRHIEDASYLRLKNISLGYAVPKSLTSKIGIGSLRVFVSGQNLLTFTKYTGLDPEVSVSPSETVQGIDQGVMPQPRVWMGGINLTF
jgi:TonB-linked SusC/RagA family outer membrane protein